MIENFKIRQGNSTDLFDADGNLKSSVVLEAGCWYLCTDTADLYICIKDLDTLVLKRLNGEAFNSQLASVETNLEAKLKNQKFFQKITSEAELPTVFDTEDFNANLIYYTYTEVKPNKPLLSFYIFEIETQQYIHINKADLEILESEEALKLWLDSEAGFVTENELTETLKATTDILENKIKLISSQIDSFSGDGDGSITKALLDSRAYTDAREEAIEKNYQDYVDQTENSLQSEIAELSKALNTVINTETANRLSAIKALSDKLGTNFDEINTVDKAIIDAKDELSLAIDKLKTTEVFLNTQAITKETFDRKKAIADLTTDLDSLVSNTSERFLEFETWKNTVSNVLTFVGVSITNPKTEEVVVPGIEAFQKGDVVLYDSKEYVNVTGINAIGAWEEFGVSTATDAALDILRTRLTYLEQEANKLSGNITNKVDIQSLEDFSEQISEIYETKANVSALTPQIAKNKSDIETDKIMLRNLESTKVSIETYNTDQELYNSRLMELVDADDSIKTQINEVAASVMLNIDEISNHKEKIILLENTYTDEQIDNQIESAVNQEKIRAEGLETTLSARLDKYDDYFSINDQGDFPSTIILDCGDAF